MGALHKHGWHEIQLDVADLAIGSSADTGAIAVWGPFLANIGVVDSDQYQLRALGLVFRATQAGAATNFFSVRLTQYSGGGGAVAAGTVRNQLAYAFSANTTPPNASTGVPIDLSGPASAFLTFPGGAAVGLPWNVFEGDSFACERISTANGLASVGFGLTLGIGKAGA